ENIVRQRRANVATSMDNEGQRAEQLRRGTKRKHCTRSGLKAKICKNACEREYDKAKGQIVCWNFGRSREGDTLVIAVEQGTLWSTRFVYTLSNGPVKEVRGRRRLRQTSWEAQLPVDHADPTDRTIFA
ncbi:hypothetical protein PV326_002079, partial [Microctonus aethiopoides]